MTNSPSTESLLEKPLVLPHAFVGSLVMSYVLAHALVFADAYLIVMGGILAVWS
ncbi:MAG: hypothetical protein Q8R32_01420 [bacterium]|nr:hypothetical protein [bacterium]